MFSVVIPLYNKAHTVLDTIDSVLAQDFAEFEIIVVDDGSTDGGAQLIRSHFHDPRIRIISQENGGEGAARNRGVAAARHDLIAFLDADDLFLPEYLGSMKLLIEEFPQSGLFCCGGVTAFPDGSGLLRHSPRYAGRNRIVDFFKNPCFFANCSSAIVPKENFLAIGGFPIDMAHRSDLVFFGKLALLGPVAFCPDLLTVYRKGVPGQATADQRGNLMASVESCNRIFNYGSATAFENRNAEFVPHLLRELRGAIRYAVAEQDYELVNYFLRNFDPGLVRQLGLVERFLYRMPSLRWAAMKLNSLHFAVSRLTGCPDPQHEESLSQRLRISDDGVPRRNSRGVWHSDSEDVSAVGPDGVSGIDDQTGSRREVDEVERLMVGQDDDAVGRRRSLTAERDRGR